MRVYISGPITGTDDYMERFERKQRELEDLGYKVVNPALLGTILPDDMKYEEYMKIDLLLLLFFLVVEREVFLLFQFWKP